MPPIKVSSKIVRHWRLWRFADGLQCSEPQAVGHIVCLWLWAAEFTRGGYVPPCAHAVADAGQWSGEPSIFIDALRRAEFMDADCRLTDWDGASGLLRVRHRPRRKSPRVLPKMRRAWQAIAQIVRPRILARDGFKCVLCGHDDRPLEVDHITPIARGGTNEEANLRTLCLPCNRRKGAKV